MREAVRRSTSPRVAMWRGRLTVRYIRRRQKYVGLKIYKKLKPHLSEESENSVVEGERYNYDNDEYVYSFLMERAPARIRGWNGGWGWVVGREMGCNSLFSLYC